MELRPLEFWDYDEWTSITKHWPKAVRKGFGRKLRVVQLGEQPQSNAKPLKGFAFSLWELWHRDGQRVIYTTVYVTLTGRIHVLDAFEKDSADGKKMRKTDKMRIEGRVTRLKTEMDRLEAEIEARRRKLH